MYSITKNGVAADPKLYTIDEVNRTFISKEDCLVLDFAGEDDWIFRINGKCEIITGDYCTIDAGFRCNITTGHGAVIRVSDNSTITAGNNCFINTHGNCTITTEDGCIINTGCNCTITVGDDCNIDAGSNCYITTEDECIMKTGSSCNITTSDHAVVVTCWDSTITGGKDCVAIRRYGNEVIKLIAGQTIRLNGYDVEGYEVVEPIETIEFEGKNYNKKEA